MATEGEPTDFIKVSHSSSLSFTWGMQVWVSFIGGFASVKQVSSHTFGLVQSKSFPVYFYCSSGSNLASSAVYAVYHPRESSDWHESVQMAMFFAASITAGSNAQWFGPAATEAMFQTRAVEEEHGSGKQVGSGSQREEYAKSREQDPKYRAYKKTFGQYHGSSNLCNSIGFICTTTNSVYTASKSSTI